MHYNVQNLHACASFLDWTYVIDMQDFFHKYNVHLVNCKKKIMNREICALCFEPKTVLWIVHQES